MFNYMTDVCVLCVMCVQNDEDYFVPLVCKLDTVPEHRSGDRPVFKQCSR